jgi:hypothetical protein
MLPPMEKLRLLSMVDILEPLSREEIKELSLRVPDTHIEQGRIFYTPYEPPRPSSCSRGGVSGSTG